MFTWSKETRYPAFSWTGSGARQDYADKHSIELHQVHWDYNHGYYSMWHKIVVE